MSGAATAGGQMTEGGSVVGDVCDGVVVATGAVGGSGKITISH